MLDQPATEVKKLEAVLHAFDRWEELEARRTRTRNLNRGRHKPDSNETETIE